MGNDLKMNNPVNALSLDQFEKRLLDDPTFYTRYIKCRNIAKQTPAYYDSVMDNFLSRNHFDCSYAEVLKDSTLLTRLDVWEGIYTFQIRQADNKGPQLKNTILEVGFFQIISSSSGKARLLVNHQEVDYQYGFLILKWKGRNGVHSGHFQFKKRQERLILEGKMSKGGSTWPAKAFLVKRTKTVKNNFPV